MSVVIGDCSTRLFLLIVPQPRYVVAEIVLPDLKFFGATCFKSLQIRTYLTFQLAAALRIVTILIDIVEELETIILRGGHRIFPKHVLGFGLQSLRSLTVRIEA